MQPSWGRILPLGLPLPGQLLAGSAFEVLYLTWGGAKQARTADLLHAMRNPISRSTSGDVERGASHLHQYSDAVGHSLSQPEHGGSPNWLPAPGQQGSRAAGQQGSRAAGQPPMTTEHGDDATL